MFKKKKKRKYQTGCFKQQKFTFSAFRTVEIHGMSGFFLRPLSYRQAAFSLCPHAASPLVSTHVCCLSLFLWGPNRISLVVPQCLFERPYLRIRSQGLGPPVWSHVITSLKGLFSNTVTLWGTGDCGFNISHKTYWEDTFRPLTLVYKSTFIGKSLIPHFKYSIVHWLMQIDLLC